MRFSHLLIKLPRKIRVWWGEVFICMLGKHGTDEFNADMILYNELRRWIDENKADNETGESV